jgi:leucine efflux protein
MFFGVTDIATFIAGTIVIVLLPGPNSLYVMSVASRYGVAAGYRGAAGIFAGDALLMLLSATGAASLLRSNPMVFMVAKYAGALYLAWMGLGLLRSALAGWRNRHGQSSNPANSTSPAVDASRPFHSALVISLMNPKAILFFVSFFIQFVDPAYPHPVLSFCILGVIVQICSGLYLSALIFGGAYLAAQFRRRRRLSAVATGGVGGLFISFSAKLASATLN